MALLTLAFGIGILSTLPMFWPRRTARPRLRHLAAPDAGTGVAFPYSAARRRGALVCLLAFVGCGVALVASGDGAVMRVVGGVTIVVFGFFSWYQLRRRVRSWALVATPTGIGMVDGPGEVLVPWQVVQDIRADETTTNTRGGPTHEPHIAVFTEPDAVQHHDAVDSKLAEIGQRWSGAEVTWRCARWRSIRWSSSARCGTTSATPDQRAELGDRRALDRIERGDLQPG